MSIYQFFLLLKQSTNKHKHFMSEKTNGSMVTVQIKNENNSVLSQEVHFL